MPDKKTGSISDYLQSAGMLYQRVSVTDLPGGHPVAQFNHVYSKIAGENGLIDRADFDPARCAPLLPWVQIFERTAEARYKVRLMGTGITKLLKGDFTGMYLDHYIDGSILDQRLQEFATVLETRQPIFSMSVVQPRDGPRWSVYRGVFPAKSSKADQLFVILAPDGERLNPSYAW